MADYGLSDESLVPLYRQVSERLKQKIVSGEFKPGAPLPTEKELCETFSVSRITVRKAMDELSGLHLIKRSRGKGTFVADAKTDTLSVTLSGVIEDVLLPYNFKLIGEAQSVPPADLVKMARADQKKYKQIEGINRSEGGTPVVHMKYYFPASIAAEITPKSLMEAHGAIGAVQLIAKRDIAYAIQTVDAVKAEAANAKYLRIDEGTALLRIARVFFDSDDLALELYEGFYHPDHYKYTARLYPRSFQHQGG